MRAKTGKTITYRSVECAFKEKRIFSSSLLHPVDRIESVLREFGYLGENEFLSDYDCDKEQFNILLDNELAPKISDSIRYKIAQFFLPK